MFLHRNIHKYIWTSPDGKTHNQIDHILIERRWHSSILHVRSFRGTDCDTDHYPVFAEFRERLAVNKEVARKIGGEWFNLNKLSDVEFRKQYHIKISNRFVALESSTDSENTNREWENTKENIKTSAKGSLGANKLKQQKTWFDEYFKDFRSDKTG